MESTNRDRNSHSLEEQLRSLDSRDVQLWSIGLLTMVVLLIGFISVVSITPSVARIHLPIPYLPQLLSGLIALVVLLNIYIIDQKRTLKRTRLALIHEIVSSGEPSLIDPLTQLWERNYLEQLLPMIMARTNRFGTPLSFIMLDLVGPNGALLDTRAEGTSVLVEISHLLRSTFRGSDNLIRYSQHRFLIVLPETTAKLACFPMERLQAKLDHWNIHCRPGQEVNMRHEIGECSPGTDPWKVIRDLERRRDSSAPASDPRATDANDVTVPVSPVISGTGADRT